MLDLVRREEKLVLLDSNGKDEEEKGFEWERRGWKNSNLWVSKKTCLLDLPRGKKLTEVKVLTEGIYLANGGKTEGLKREFY